MEEEKKSISETLGIIGSTAFKIASNIFPALLKKQSENLEKKVKKLEEKKQQLETNIELKHKNEMLRQKLKELKRDIINLKSFDKDKIIAQFKDLVVEAKNIPESSNSLFSNSQEANSMLQQLEKSLNNLLMQYKITGREVNALNGKDVDLEGLHNRIQDFEKNIKMMIEEYSQTFNYFKGINEAGLKAPVDFNKVFNDMKINLSKDKDISSELKFDIKAEIEKYKKENQQLKVQTKENREKITELRKEKEELKSKDTLKNIESVKNKKPNLLREITNIINSNKKGITYIVDGKNKSNYMAINTLGLEKQYDLFKNGKLSVSLKSGEIDKKDLLPFIMDSLKGYGNNYKLFNNKDEFDKFQGNKEESKTKDEKIINVEPRDVEVDKYDYANEDNPNYVAVEQVANSTVAPNKFEFKGNLEDIKFFNDKPNITFSDIKKLDKNMPGLGEKVFSQYISLSEQGYLKAITDSKDFKDNKFEITDKGKQYLKEANFITNEKVNNKEIRESTKIKSSGIER